MKLRYKIFLYFGTFVLIIVLSFAAVNYFIIERSLHENARKEVRQMVESVNVAANTLLSAIVHNYMRGVVDQDFVVLNQLYSQVQEGFLSEKVAKNKFQEYVLDHKIGKSGYIVALRPAGTKIIIDIHPHVPGTDCSFNQGCQEWIARKNGFNEYTWKNPEDATTRKKVGYFRYFEPWNWVVGATSYRDEFTQLVKKEDLEELIRPFKILEHGYFFVINDRYELIIHPESEGSSIYAVQNEKGTYVGRELLKHQDDFYYYSWKNPSDKNEKKKFAYVKLLKDFNWYVVASGYIDDINDPVRRLMGVSYVLVAVAAVLLTVMTLLFSKSLTFPLNSLIEGLKAFYDEGKVFQMRFKTVAEVEAVGRSIERMTAALVDSERDRQNLLDQLNSIINFMPSVLIGVDDEEKVVLWNEKASEVTGFSKKNALDAPVGRLLKKFDSELEMIRKNIRSHASYHSTFKIDDADGLILFYEITLYPLSRHMNLTVLRIDDVTERVRMEEALLQTRKMDAVGQLAGGVAHDFNNMLTGILNSVSILELHMGRDDKLFKFIKIIKAASIRASELTQNLLSFSRKNPTMPALIHVHEAVHEAVAILSRSMDKSVKIMLNLRADNDLISGDFSLLQTLVMNLGINASHAMPDGGTFTVRSSEIELTGAACKTLSQRLEAGLYIKLEVEDSGVGIPKGIIDKVFEPFFTTKRQGEGTGLGLASAYGAVLQHKGEIFVSSIEGLKTVFTIYLPQADSAAPSDVKTESEVIISGAGTILVIDDEALLRQTATDMLEFLGYQVLTAENGKAGLTLFKKYQADIRLVLLDMAMPEMGGRECFLKLLELNPNVAVIIVTGFADETDLDRIRKEGVRRIISKPYEFASLSKTISEVLGEPGI